VSSGTTLTLAGFAQGAGGLTKVGLGTLTLLANNNYSLGTTVNGGTLLVNGTQAQSTAVNANAKLGGSGAVGAVTSTGGTISPGQSPGILSTGNLSLNASSTFNVELNGTTPGTGYDRVAVNGSVTLGSAALQVAVGYTPSPGDTFTIIQNDGTGDAVTGTFSGLANGAMFVPTGSYQFQIFYNGGDGNDVVLSYVGCVTDFSGPTVTPPADTTVTQTLCQ
ncbi:MAG TPA: autotransporter, partial [Thermoanaerobaculia bacterium]|nr:autotransporter [Thermoanaerobaculia bacterium]